MPIEDVSHVRGGLLVTFRHPCGHLSNPLPYDTLAQAEAALPGMDAVPCWPCRTLAAEQEVGS